MHWFWQICTFKKSDLGKWEREVQICPKSASFTRPPVRPPRHRHRPRTGRQLQTADCAPPAHLLPQYCTLLGKTRPRHRPHSGTAGTASSPRHICCPSTASSHRLPTPSGTTRPPANPNPTCKQRTPRPPNGRRGVNTQRGVSARRLTRQLRKSPRPQRRHLRCRLLARPLRERQRPQEQQR